jgi:hypothetical protein
MKVVITAATQVLAHVPSLVRYGSKPSREKVDLAGSLRTFEQAVSYEPHQAYLGAIHPRAMGPRPWWCQPARNPGLAPGVSNANAVLTPGASPGFLERRS